MDDGETVASTVGNGDDTQLHTAIIFSYVDKGVSIDDGLSSIDHRSQDMSVADAVPPRRTSNPDALHDPVM